MRNCPLPRSVAAMKDGKIDAFFLERCDAPPHPSSTWHLHLVSEWFSFRWQGERSRHDHEICRVSEIKIYWAGIMPLIKMWMPLYITAVLVAMDTFPARKDVPDCEFYFFQYHRAFSSLEENATKLTPASAVNQMAPEAVKFLHPGSYKFFQGEGCGKIR